MVSLAKASPNVKKFMHNDVLNSQINSVTINMKVFGAE